MTTYNNIDITHIRNWWSGWVGAGGRREREGEGGSNSLLLDFFLFYFDSTVS